VKYGNNSGYDTEEVRPKIGHPHSPGIREIQERVRKFSSKKGTMTFVDFEETSKDCK